MWHLKVNGQAVPAEEGESLFHLLHRLDMAAKSGIAVAINAEVIPKNKWNEKILTASDDIIIIEAAQGG